MVDDGKKGGEERMSNIQYRILNFEVRLEGSWISDFGMRIAESGIQLSVICYQAKLIIVFCYLIFYHANY